MAAKATIDRETIREWVEKQGGSPAHVNKSGRDDDPGILRIDFPGFSGENSLEQISWEQLFEWFDDNELALLYQDDNRFNKLVSRDSVREQLQEQLQDIEGFGGTLVDDRHQEAARFERRSRFGQGRRKGTRDRRSPVRAVSPADARDAGADDPEMPELR